MIIPVFLSSAVGDDGNESSVKRVNSERMDLYQAAGVDGRHSSDNMLQTSSGVQAAEQSAENDPLTAFRVSPRVAKSVLRVRRGWFDEEEEEEEETREIYERRREAEALAAHLNR